MDLEGAHRAARNGAIAAFVSAGLTFLVVVLAMALSPTGPLAYFADPWLFLDVLLLAALGLGTLYHSRAAAVTLVLFFLFGKWIFFLETGGTPSILLSLIFLYFFVYAVYGTFRYHRLRKDADPAYRPAAAWVPWVLGAVVVLLAPLMGLGALTYTSLIPSSAIVGGADVAPDRKDFFRSRGILQPDERILFFYSNALWHFEKDGNLLTNRRVVSYFQEEGELVVKAARFDRIQEVAVLEEGDFFNPTRVGIFTGPEQGFVLLLSSEEGRDRLFLDKLRQKQGAGLENPL